MTGRELLAHRALVAAVVHGVLEAEDAARLVVAKDGAAFDALDSSGVVAVVASSPSVAALVALAKKHGTEDPDSDWNGDEAQAALASASQSESGSSVPCFSGGAWARALAWSSARATATVAPPLSHDRLHALTTAAESAGLSLVVPDVALVSPPLAQLAQTRFPRTPLARAALHLYARGSLAFPLLFVPHARATKNGLPKTKLDRIADGWVVSSRTVPPPPSASLAPLVASAMEILAEHEAPLSFKELLRAARERRGTVATGDAKQLASALYRLWSDHAVELFAIDPQGHLPFSS